VFFLKKFQDWRCGTWTWLKTCFAPLQITTTSWDLCFGLTFRLTVLWCHTSMEADKEQSFLPAWKVLV